MRRVNPVQPGAQVQFPRADSGRFVEEAAAMNVQKFALATQGNFRVGLDEFTPFFKRQISLFFSFPAPRPAPQPQMRRLCGVGPPPALGKRQNQRLPFVSFDTN
jgi:hypothetical protein